MWPSFQRTRTSSVVVLPVKEPAVTTVASAQLDLAGRILISPGRALSVSPG
jgi:hypothetical protein